MTDGGVFATTAWTAYAIYDNAGDPLVMTELDAIVPFDYQTGVVNATHDYSGDYTVTSASSPLTAGLPATWSVVVAADGGDCIEPKAGAVSVVDRDFDYNNDLAECPREIWTALAYISVGSGTGIWLNSDLGYEDSAAATPELLRAINNIVTFTVSSSATPTAVPVASLWLLGIMIGLAGFTGMAP